MNKKGFTLVELLGVVAILAMLGLVIVPVISNVLSDNKEKLYDVQINNIKSGASSFVAENIFDINISSGDSVGITLGDLKNLGYIDEDIKDPITRNNFSDDLAITITNQNGVFTYTVCTEGVSCNLDIPFYDGSGGCAEIFCEE
jgi:prepilin-type N-terminal cleavage/methylation domain-containing protein